MARHIQDFQTIHSEGGLLPPDLLRRILEPNEKIPGTLPEDYGLPHGERINETITQSWNRLRRHWAEFREATAHLPGGDAGTGLTNDKWNLPVLRELGFGMLPTSPGPEINGRTYAITRFFGTTAIHMIGCGLSLDRRAAGVRGAALANPHGLVQEFLNRSEGHLWAIVSNGLCLRILRDNQALSRQSYLEFDLEAIFSGEVFSDFVLLWLMAHATRFAAREEGKPESCWLEEWTSLANEQGARALESLRGGVERALQVLGQGFVGHPRNSVLREALRSGNLTLADFHGQLLRVVYRLIFVFVTEDRSLDGISLLHPVDDSEEGRVARERYAAHYSTARLRELASRIKGSRHGDLWQQFNLLVGALSGEKRFEAARKHLALPTLGSFLWSRESTSAINATSLTEAEGAELTNADLLDALRHLAFVRQNRILRPVDYKNLGAEELGGVYESLLTLTPQISGDGARFTFAEFAGNERKTSGSYYTPDCLVQCLLDSALDPVVEEAIKGKTGAEAEQALLKLKVCDPACGSGHFLVGAAHRLARYLARVRALAQGESEPSPTLYHAALRDVIGHCLYGVDINPMAAELCKVSLWLEAIEPGKPLTFLDHHIQVGNSLLGTTPALLKLGIPDDAFKPIEGDDKEFCTKYKRRNKEERVTGQEDLFDDTGQPWQRLGNLGAAMLELDRLKDDTMEGLHAKEEAYARHVQSSGYLFNKFLHDAWCAAFVWVKSKADERPYPITQQMLGRIERNPHDCPPWMHGEVVRLAEQYQFFHWHLAFPEVFTPKSAVEIADAEVTGWTDGFSVVLGNPPWERVKLQEKEWFAQRSPEVANAPNADQRKRLILTLKQSDPMLHSAFLADLRRAEGESHLIRHARRYPLCGRGDINTYAIFAELKRTVISGKGRVGCIVPSGISTDDTTKFFFQALMEETALVSLLDFENSQGVFPGVHREQKFCLLTLTGLEHPCNHAQFTFFARNVDEASSVESRFVLSSEDIALLNPNTGTCPIFRTRLDAELTKAIYRRVPVLIKEARSNHSEINPWRVCFQTLFHMSNDSGLFRSSKQLEADGWELRGNIFKRNGKEYVPLYEGKLTDQYDHRAASFAIGQDVREVPFTDHAIPTALPLPRYWVPREECPTESNSLLSFHRVANPNNVRSSIFTLLPPVGASDSLFFLTGITPDESAILCATGNSYAFDYLTRLSVGSRNFSFFIVKQLAVPTPDAYSRCLSCAISKMVMELTFTAWDIGGFARDLKYDGPPFLWDDHRRFSLRCTLDAVFFDLYLGEPQEWLDSASGDLLRDLPTPRDAVMYIMETFPTIKRQDEDSLGEYRTKRVILEIYDAMQEAVGKGELFQSQLNPLPGPPIDADGNFISMYQWDRDNWPPHIHSPHPDWDESLLSAWFDICQKHWRHLDDDQIFPWDGREAFIYALIPYLVKERPGEKFEFYRDAALLASHPDRCEALLLDSTQRTEYGQAVDRIDWLKFPDTHRIRPKDIREKLQVKQLIATAPKTGATTLVDEHRLPTLPMPLHPLLPLILQAADTLDRLQRRALETAEAAKISFTYDDISREFTAMSVA